MLLFFLGILLLAIPGNNLIQVNVISFCEERTIDESEISGVDVFFGIDTCDLEKETDEKKTFISFFQIVLPNNFSSRATFRIIHTENRNPGKQFLFALIDLPPPSILLSSEQ